MLLIELPSLDENLNQNSTQAVKNKKNNIIFVSSSQSVSMCKLVLKFEL